MRPASTFVHSLTPPLITAIAITVLSVLVCTPQSVAHETYEGCADCHGNFRASSYISLADGMNWGNLHNLHRSTMLSGDCVTCHGGDFGNVTIGLSDGGTGFEAIGCMGCHGRNEDMGHDSISAGRGAGLRQHHTNAGISDCTDCHADADPANYTPVGENVAPSYYFLPDADHPDKPTDPCNLDGNENYAGLPQANDNDGDGLYDGDDPDCGSPCPADLDGSGDVGFTDLVQVLSTWGNVGGPEDIDNSGMVDFGDLLVVLASWGPC